MAILMKHGDLNISLDFDRFPDRHTCKGDDISPRIRIKGAEQPYLALLLEDHDAKEKPYVHWVMWNMPFRSEIPENVSKLERPPEIEGAVQGSTTGNSIGYEGPCPPRGSTHKYEFKVYGYDAPLDLGPGATRMELLKALDGMYLQYGEAAADYSR